MNPASEPSAWDRVAAARRKVLPAQVPVDECPPPGFSTRIAARWGELRENERLRLWSRWSLRAALGGLLTAGIMALFSSPPAPAGALRAPEIELPAFSAP